ncbi:MAG: DUF2019 domain-containing protein [Alphaproteobacteria bacterium]|nr:DUF2019 domain-containing protein [Alphaproteobacteria bacterium]
MERNGREVVTDALDEATLRGGPIEVLVERYVDTAIAAEEAIEHGRVTRHNRLSDRVRAIGKALKARAPDGREALLRLLSHPDPKVRSFATFDCREIVPGGPQTPPVI